MFRKADRRTPFDNRNLPSRTKQSHKDECDIHNIMRQFSRTGVIEHVNRAVPLMGDLPEGLDYQQALNTLIEGQEAFALLPASVRERFQNDPAQFLSAFQDEKQHEYLRSVGLLKPLPKTDPEEVTQGQ